ncbi:MAG: 4-alpha-glucanotransferase [Ruminococcaceae bacterium]|nr:4-alpha-glucanotransferase [Oscillospiraceae bacterium]
MNRKSGILMHISSLYNNYSCGNFGKSAYEFIDFLKKCGFTYWQVLPFCITDEHNSPYMSYSSIGGNMFFIDIEQLYKEGFITKDELLSSTQKTPFACEFQRLKEERFSLLLKASKRVTDKSVINDFIKKNKSISDCCEFMALKEANEGQPWNKWTITQPEPDTLFAWQFIQYIFHTQWEKLHIYANINGIKIIGDLPFYVSYDSCDVRNNTKQFLLDEDNKPSCVAGVPPDYFSEDGQLWGNPIYNWDYMKKDGYTWWKNRLSYMLTLFDGVRIDHFRAFSEYWAVPAGAKTAKEGKWYQGPANEMIDVIKEIAGDRLIIAENLGLIDSKVDDLLKYSDFPGMSVFQFGFDGNNANPHLPHNFKQNLVAYTGTHDNNTLLGFIWELDNYTRKAVLDYVGYSNEQWNNCYDTIIKTLFMSCADTVILPIQDIMGFGADTRLNIPGKADNNWSFRITKQQLDSIDTQKYKHMNHIYSR